MHKTIAVLLGIVCFFTGYGESQGGLKTDATDASDVKTLFFLTMMIGCPSPILPNRRGMPSGN